MGNERISVFFNTLVYPFHHWNQKFMFRLLDSFKIEWLFYIILESHIEMDEFIFWQAIWKKETF